ncbi:hypothetical protein ES319_D03G067500v1 [Gossypium barbadense]|uniref:DUF4371 domain-containing protein n=2 Tax=Gossypium TaxID=3633 RepID=A0A5J5S8N8_GOSBA|nr:hypothetical protein ES319_D03G067500v1 [Gossypium barbadense]TYG75947.1 hypothetical protein ES288_D03G074000v1 [Gossypium darwinii]
MQSRDLINQAQHILHIIEKQTSQEVANNRLILKTSIDVVRWLTFQACSLRGHNERTSSTNRGNFLELIKLLAFYNERVASVVLDNAPQNASYTSHSVQKEILHIFAKKIRCFICEEIGELKFCIIVDVARDESKREQMANVLRFVDKVGFGCDGASNMHGEWPGLQALVSNECPYVYYKKNSAYHLQLTLIAAYPELQASQEAKIERLLSIDELKTSKGLNQIGNVKRARDTRWTYNAITSFEFVFIFHLMIDIMEITHDLCQALQHKSQDIVNVMHIKRRWIGFFLFEKVKSFCEKHGIDVLDINAPYTRSRSISSSEGSNYNGASLSYRLFYAKIDSQLQELNEKFKEDMAELLMLCSALDPREDNKSFNIDNISTTEHEFSVMKIVKTKI